MKPRTILIVDDSADDCLILKTTAKFEALSTRLRIVREGRTALDYLRGRAPYFDRSRHPLPDLVLLDLNMPGLNGFEVLSSIRSQVEFANLPVFIFTSSNDPRDIQKAYNLGANAYLVKPMDFDELVVLLKTLENLAVRNPRDSSPLRKLPVFRPDSFLTN